MKVLNLFIILIMAISLHAVSFDDMQHKMEHNIQKGLETLGSDSTMDEKSKQLFSLMDSMFNYSLMARLSASTNWNNLSSEEKGIFVQKYEAQLKNTLIQNLVEFNDVKIEVFQPKKVNNRVHLSLQINKDQNLYEMVFKFHEAEENHWLIYDVDILGVSIIQSFRGRLSSYDGGSFENLLQLLEGEIKL